MRNLLQDLEGVYKGSVGDLLVICKGSMQDVKGIV